MPTFRTSRRVQHSSEDMFDLVADVDKYPLFVPFCTALTVKDRREDAKGRPVLTALMTVSFKLIREKFMSRVILDKPAGVIDVEYLSGPFTRMQNIWTFKPAPAPDGSVGSTIEFFIDYEFRSRILAGVMGAMFELMFHRFTDAFERRADEIYGVGRGTKPGLSEDGPDEA